MENSDKNILGIRLKLARKMAGMSLQELSDQLNNLVTKQSLNKYELGVMRPTNDVVIEISRILKVKPEYFLKKNIIKIEKVSFRKKASLSRKIEESIVEKAKEYVERFSEIENILNEENEFDNPLKEIVINDGDDVEKASLMLRSFWRLELNPIMKLVELLEVKKIKVLLIDEVDDVDGFSFFASNNIPVVVVNIRKKSNDRIRFTIIHELAHLLLVFKEGISEREIELLCHRFASSFLLPMKNLFEIIGGKHRSYISINELIRIKESYGISIRAIVYRLNDLNIITQNYYQRWMIYMSKTYGQKEEPGEYAIEEKEMMLERLVSRALSEELISISKAASLLDTSVNNLRKGYLGVK